MPLLASTRRPGRLGMLFVAAMAGMLSLPGRSAVGQPTTAKRILLLPTLQWDADGIRWRYASEQSDTELSRAMAGMIFGMRPEDVGLRLPQPAKELHWDDLPVAPEFSDEVRYTWLRMNAAGELIAPINACFGAPSYIVVMFRASGLFRVSWRFLPDPGCHDVTQAAAELYATFVPIASTVALSVHYHTGYAEVVDVTDPHATILVTQRWQMPGQ